MRYYPFNILITIVLLLLSVPSFSQNESSLAKADSLYRLGRVEYDEERFESAISFFDQAIVVGKMY